MSWLFEDSTSVLAVTVLVEIILIVALLRSGKTSLLYVVLVVAVACSACVAIELMVETDRERIEQVIEQTRSAVLANDREQVFHLIAPESRNLRSEAARSLAQYLFSGIKITDGPQIVLYPMTTPPSASVAAVARLDLKAKKGPLAYRGSLLRVEARLKETPAGWRWTEAAFSSPLSRYASG